MIVDDHASFRAILREFLPRETTRIRECGDGAEAITAYEEERPDFVLMDLSMPVMDGLQATVEILHRDPTACIVMVTHHNDNITRNASTATGARAFLSKSELHQLPKLLRTMP